MCIRDREKAEEKLDAATEKSFAELEKELEYKNNDDGMPYRMEPVSYTHLDVYKRQQEAGAVFVLQRTGKAENIFYRKDMQTVQPVSYTHLDVYKRQQVIYCAVTFP